MGDSPSMIRMDGRRTSRRPLTGPQCSLEQVLRHVEVDALAVQAGKPSPGRSHRRRSGWAASSPASPGGRGLPDRRGELGDGGPSQPKPQGFELVVSLRDGVPIGEAELAGAGDRNDFRFA